MPAFPVSFLHEFLSTTADVIKKSRREQRLQEYFTRVPSLLLLYKAEFNFGAAFELIRLLSEIPFSLYRQVSFDFSNGRQIHFVASFGVSYTQNMRPETIFGEYFFTAVNKMYYDGAVIDVTICVSFEHSSI